MFIILLNSKSETQPQFIHGWEASLMRRSHVSLIQTL